jgi:hypothetical protein
MSPGKPTVSSTVETVPGSTTPRLSNRPESQAWFTKRRVFFGCMTVSLIVAAGLLLRPESSGPYRDDEITVYGGGATAERRSVEIGDVAAREVVELGDTHFVVGSVSDGSALYPVVNGRLGPPRPFDSEVFPDALGVTGDRMVANDWRRDRVVTVDAKGATVESSAEERVTPVLGPDGFLWWRTAYGGSLRRQRVDGIEDPAQEAATILQIGQDRPLVGAGVGRVFVALDGTCDQGLIAIDSDGEEEQVVEFPRAASCGTSDALRAPLSNVTKVAEDGDGNLWMAATVLAVHRDGLFVLRASDGSILDVSQWIDGHPFLGRLGFRFDGALRFDAGTITFGVSDLSFPSGVVEVDDIDSLLADLQPVPLLSAAGLPNVPPPLTELQLADPLVPAGAVSPADATLSSEFNPRTLNRWYLSEIGMLSQVDPDGTIISSLSVGTPFGGAYAYGDGVMLLTCPASCDSSRVLTFVHGDGSVERRPLPVGHQVDALFGADDAQDRVMLLSGGDDVAFTKWWLPWPSAVDPIDTGIGTGEIDAGLDAQGRVILMRAGRLVIVGNDGDIALTAPLTAEQQTVPTVVQLTRGPVTLDQLSLDVDAVATGPDGTTFIATTDGIVLSARGGEPVRYLAGGAEFVNGASGDLGIIYRLSVVDGSLFIDAGSIFRIDLDDL